MESFWRCQVSCFLSAALERGLGLARETWLFRLQAKKQRAPGNDSILFYSIISRWTCPDRVGKRVGGVIIEKNKFVLKCFLGNFKCF